MKDKLLSLLVSFILFVLLLNGWMYFQQPRMIFFPYRPITVTPADWGMEFEEVFLRTSDDVQIHGWYIPRKGSSRALLFFHGNAGNISHRSESLAILHRLGWNVFIFDYRGYGKSSGMPTEKGLYDDARAAWKYLTDDKGFQPNDITLFGRSLGGAIAADLAVEVQPGGVILESSFSSARDVANAVFPMLSKLIYMRFGFSAVARVRLIHSPLLILHSRDDEIIPFQLGQKIYRAANQPKFFYEITGDHNAGFLQSQPQYEVVLSRFSSGTLQELQERSEPK